MKSFPKIDITILTVQIAQTPYGKIMRNEEKKNDVLESRDQSPPSAGDETSFISVPLSFFEEMFNNPHQGYHEYLGTPCEEGCPWYEAPRNKSLFEKIFGFSL